MLGQDPSRCLQVALLTGGSEGQTIVLWDLYGLNSQPTGSLTSCSLLWSLLRDGDSLDLLDPCYIGDSESFQSQVVKR